MAFDLNAIMDGVGVRLATITGLRVYDHPPDSVAAPAAVVSFPSVEYDVTMGRGSDRLSLPVHVLVGLGSDRAARDALSAYLAGSGALSVKAAIEADKTLSGSASTVRVTDAAVEVMTVGAVEYVAATFTLDVIA